MEGHSSVSADILESYARDAAGQVAGVAGVAGGARHRGVRIASDESGVAVELRLALEWGASAAAVGGAVQDRVASYLSRMADIAPRSIEVVVDEVVPPAAVG
jgi:uncharacterized alkaline shock family protein YloU